jgi:hypothetical protein
MDGRERLKLKHGVVIWENGSVYCSRLTLTPNNIEIRVVVNGSVLDYQRFGDADSATRYAIEKMRVYTAD